MVVQGPVSLRHFIQPKFEPELAVVLKQDISPAASQEMVRQAIQAVYLGIDILDSIWADYRFSIAEVVADNSSGGGFLRGTQPLLLPVEGMLRLSLNGNLLVEGSFTAPGQIEECLSWLASQVKGLAAGQIIYLGSPVAAQTAMPGRVELLGPQESLLAVTFDL